MVGLGGMLRLNRVETLWITSVMTRWISTHMLPLFHVSSLAGPSFCLPIQIFDVRKFMGMKFIKPHFPKQEEKKS